MKLLVGTLGSGRTLYQSYKSNVIPHIHLSYQIIKCLKGLVLVLTIFNEGAYLTWISIFHSWNQPVLSNEGRSFLLKETTWNLILCTFDLKVSIGMQSWMFKIYKLKYFGGYLVSRNNKHVKCAVTKCLQLHDSLGVV